MHGIEAFSETSCQITCVIWIRARHCVQRNENFQISHRNVLPTNSKPQFPLICDTLGAHTSPPMTFMKRLVCPKSCTWYRARATNNLSQNEFMKLELPPNGKPKAVNSCGPTLQQLGFRKSRTVCNITFRDQHYESRVQTQFMLIKRLVCSKSCTRYKTRTANNLSQKTIEETRNMPK